MPRTVLPPDLAKELRTARKVLKGIRALDPALNPKWHAGMVRHWTARVKYLESVAKHYWAK